MSQYTLSWFYWVLNLILWKAKCEGGREREGRRGIFNVIRFYFSVPRFLIHVSVRVFPHLIHVRQSALYRHYKDRPVTWYK